MDKSSHWDRNVDFTLRKQNDRLTECLSSEVTVATHNKLPRHPLSWHRTCLTCAFLVLQL